MISKRWIAPKLFHVGVDPKSFPGNSFSFFFYSNCKTKVKKDEKKYNEQIIPPNETYQIQRSFNLHTTSNFDWTTTKQFFSGLNPFDNSDAKQNHPLHIVQQLTL